MRFTRWPLSRGRSADPEISVWTAVPADQNIGVYRRLVTLDERVEACRLRAKGTQAQWLACRALLRMLTEELGARRGDSFERRCPCCGASDHGSPFAPTMPWVHLSVSRTDRLVAVCASPQPVGLDVELVRHPVPITSAVFSPRQADRLSTMPAKVRSESWATKEAIGKLCGLGLLGASQSETPFPVIGRWVSAIDGAGAACWVRRLDCGPHVAGALASRRPGLVQARLVDLEAAAQVRAGLA